MTVDRLLCWLFENRTWGKMLDILNIPWQLLPGHHSWPEPIIYKLSPGRLFLLLEDFFCPDGKRAETRNIR